MNSIVEKTRVNKPRTGKNNPSHDDYDHDGHSPLLNGHDHRLNSHGPVDPKPKPKTKPKPKAKSKPKPKPHDDVDYDASSAEIQERILGAVLALQRIPAEFRNLTQEHFNFNNGVLWEELVKVGGEPDDLAISALLAGSRDLHFYDWTRSKLESLVEQHDEATNLKLLADKLCKAYVLHEAERLGKFIATKAAMGQLIGVEIQAQKLQNLIAQIAKSKNDLATISSAEFAKLDCTVKYLIEGVLVEAQPMVIGALSKSMKTSLMLDAAVSLATGTKFLDRFQCMKTPVMVYSGESGRGVLQATTKSICKAKGIKLSQVDVRWGFQVPLIGEERQVQILRREMQQHGTKVLFIDPTYLALASEGMSEHAGNVFHFGRLLKGISETCQELGVTLVLLHHFRKTGEVDPLEPCKLERLAQAGFAEWSRQWILLERLVRYADDGKHELVLRTGGSAGHSGLYYLKIDEGKPKGNRWLTTVLPFGEYKAQQKQQEQDAVAVEEHKKLMSQASAVQLMLAGGAAKPISSLGLGNNAKAAKIVGQLVGMGKLKVVKKKAGNGKTLDHYKWVGDSHFVPTEITEFAEEYSSAAEDEAPAAEDEEKDSSDEKAA